MPGTTLIVNHHNGLGQLKGRLDATVSTFGKDKRFKHDILINDDSVFLSVNYYNQYPVELYEHHEYYILIEGYIYDKRDKGSLSEELVNMCDVILGQDDPFFNQVKQWILNNDGDYIILVLSKKTNRFIFINDALGRLPVYYKSTEGQVIISREIGFVLEFEKPLTDPQGINQYLLTGYPWGKRTLFRDVNYLPPGGIAFVDKNKMVRIRQLVDYNFDDRIEVDSPDTAAKNLVYLFHEALKSRTAVSDTNLLSLSGGLDSRAILASARQLDVDIRNATYLDYKKEVIEDVRIAKELSKKCRAPLDIIKLKPPLTRHYNDLLNFKQGLNYLGMSFILPFFESVQKNGMHYITGDGGDKVLPDIRPLERIHSHEKLLDYILKTQSIFKMGDVARLTGTNEEDLKEDLFQHLRTYPEQNLENKYIHFQITERAMKWLFEGEDRNRYYFWSSTPFYALPFFDYAVKLPVDFKKDFMLFRKFLYEISPDLVNIENANWGIALSDERFSRFLRSRRIRSKIPVSLKTFVKKFKRKKPYSRKDPIYPLLKYFKEQQKTTESLKNILDFETMESLAEFTEDQFYYLFTLTAAFEKIEKGKTSISEFLFEDM